MTHEDGVEKKSTQTATLKDGLLTLTVKDKGMEMKIIMNKQ